MCQSVNLSWKIVAHKTVVFSQVFVPETKIISGYIFVAPLKDKLLKTSLEQ